MFVRRYIILSILFVCGICLCAQDNKQRAESMIAMAVQKEAEGGTPAEFNPLFEQAVNFTPQDAQPYLIWGLIIAKYAEANDSLPLLANSFEKFGKAIELKPDYTEAYNTWAVCLSYYAGKTKDDTLYDEIYAKFAKAAEFSPRTADIYMNWGMSLLDHAKGKKDANLYRECIAKFDKVLELDSDVMLAWNNKGYAYLNIARVENNYRKNREELQKSLIRAEQLGSQAAAYNLACYYSLAKEKDEAFAWLEKSMVKSRSYTSGMYNFTKEYMDADKDLDNIRRDKRYKQLIKDHFGK